MDVNVLLKALDNDENDKMFNYTTDGINKMNDQILSELGLPIEIKNTYLTKLQNHIYIDEMHMLKCGSHIKWISLDTLKLSGAICCNLKITDVGMSIICKGFAHKHFQINMENNIIFQKLSQQEQVLLSAMDYLQV